MAISVFPQPATTGAVEDNWVFIASSTPTSGTSISFTSIPTNYRKLRLVTDVGLLNTTNANCNLTVNSLSGTDDYIFMTFNTAIIDDDKIQSNSTNKYSYDLEFVNALTAANISATFSGYVSTTRAIWKGRIANLTTPITQLDLTLSAGDFSTNTATISLYGTV
jgi:hypothetical protein